MSESITSGTYKGVGGWEVGGRGGGVDGVGGGINPPRRHVWPSCRPEKRPHRLQNPFGPEASAFNQLHVNIAQLVLSTGLRALIVNPRDSTGPRTSRVKSRPGYA